MYKLDYMYKWCIYFSCQCVFGFEGDRCETNIDDCLIHTCLNNATCVDLVDDYRWDFQKFFMVLQFLKNTYLHRFLIPAPKAGVIVVAFAVRAAAAAAAAGINLVGVPQTKPCSDFYQTFRISQPPKDLELIRFWAVSSNNCCLGNAFFQIFGS